MSISAKDLTEEVTIEVTVGATAETKTAKIDDKEAGNGIWLFIFNRSPVL